MPRIGIAHKATVMMAHMVNSTVPRPPPLGAGAHWSRWSPTHFGGWRARRATVFEPAQYAAPQPNHHRLWGEHSDQPADGHETAQRQPGSGERHIIEQRHRNTPIRGEIPGDGVNGSARAAVATAVPDI